MIFSPKEIALKDGRTAILRSPKPRDAFGMIEFLRTVCAQTDFLLRRPEECGMSEEQERGWILRNVVGRRPYAIRRQDGSFADEILMQRVLDEGKMG